MRFTAVIPLLILPAFLLSCAKSEIDIVAEVGGEPITVTDVERILVLRRDWSEAEIDSSRVRALNKLIEGKLLAREAERMGYRDHNDINESLDEVKKMMLVEQLYREAVIGRARVEEWRVRRLYDRLAEEVKARHILVESRELADSIYAELTEGGGSFEELALLTVDERTKGNGGVLGWLRWGRKMPDEFFKVAFSLRIGEISRPLKTKRGYQIIKVDDRRKVERRPYEEWRGKIRRLLQMPEVKQLETEYFERMRRRARIEVDEEVLRMLAEKTPERDTKTLAPPPLPEVSEEDRERVLATSILGEWTVGRVLDEAGKSRRRPYFREPYGVKTYIEWLITYELLLVQAKRLHLDKSPEVSMRIEHEIDGRMADKLGRETYARVEASSTSEDELVEYYHMHIDRFSEPEKVRASMILVSSEVEANEVLRRLHQGADFTALARDRSIHPSKERGGDLGFFARGTDPEMDEVAFALKPGEISQITETEDGLAIIKVTERKPSRVMPFEETRESVRRALLSEKQEDELQKLLSRLREKTEIVIDQDKLRMAGADPWR